LLIGDERLRFEGIEQFLSRSWAREEPAVPLRLGAFHDGSHNHMVVGPMKAARINGLKDTDADEMR
jgi:hypothetical protein